MLYRVRPYHSLRTPNGTGYPLTDALGSVIAVTDTNGAVVNQYDYTPYGRTTETRATGALDNPWRFTGAHHGPGGLYKMGARYHHPNVARWTQTDPALLPHQLPFGNEYLYANCNPTNYTDPSGTHVVFELEWLLARYGWLVATSFICGGIGLAISGATALTLTAAGIAASAVCKAGGIILWRQIIEPRIEH